jgi:hypothetical protein
MLIALIADQGLVPYYNELDLVWRSSQAFRRLRSGKPRYGWASPVWWMIALIRLLFRAAGSLRSGRHPRYDKRDNFHPVIRFVGVWDTVAAYGGPFAEVTRAVDNWIYRLSMPDHKLDPKVHIARHALALDDERDAFHPLLWDEVTERALIEERETDPSKQPSWITGNRLEQVWFCGMHSDVGGGYPDESLSYVSLLWMLEEAKLAGLRPITSITDRYRALANSYGPIHNSRAGLASYYRYQPRNISAWLDPVAPATLSLRDPAIRTAKGAYGLLTHVKIHESVIARIASGTDRYAPFSLPREFQIHPPGALAEHRPLNGNDEPHARRAAMFDRQAEHRLQDPVRTGWAYAAMGSVWDQVWFRRGTYFATLLATLALLAMPLWVSLAPYPPILTDGRTWIGGLIGLLELFAPRFLDPWIRVYEHNAFYTLLLVGLIVAFWTMGNRLELHLRDRARVAWRWVLTQQSDSAFAERIKPSPWQRLRTAGPYQRTIQVLKWHVFPFVFGLFLIATAAWVALGILTQVSLPTLESRANPCPAPRGEPELRLISRDFSTRSLCNPMLASVRRGTRYDVSFYVVDDWFDSDRPATPTGLGVADYRWGSGFLGVPLKRVVTAGYLQPVMEIRPRTPKQNPIDPPVFIYPLELKRAGDSPNLYRGTFTATRDGDLYLFANDAVLPFTDWWSSRFNLRYFYEYSGPSEAAGNRGTACVLIANSAEGTAAPVKAESKICRRAVDQERAAETTKLHSTSHPPALLQ